QRRVRSSARVAKIRLPQSTTTRKTNRPMIHRAIPAIITTATLASACTAIPPPAAAAKPAAGHLVNTTHSSHGAPLPASPHTAPEITMLRITVPPRSQLPMHSHPVINAGYLVAGELVVHTADGETLHMAAGDPIVELVNKPHYGSNPGSEPAVIVVFYAGTAGTPLTVIEE